jgi:NADPH-dependent 2,4-dienoyl-CoA reductase/sulfur reductase-like enzyme
MGKDMSNAKTVAIVGAGPVGLAAAAHALERRLKPIVLEAGLWLREAISIGRDSGSRTKRRDALSRRVHRLDGRLFSILG